MFREFLTLVKKPKWLQAVTKQATTWSSAAEVADWENNIPTLQDDGVHVEKSPFYFEWWYFDATFGEGSAVSIIFHMTDLINPFSGKGSVNVVVFDEGNPLYKRFIPYEPGLINAARDRCDVRIGKNRCRVEGDIYKILIEESGIDVELEFESEITGWRPGSGTFHFGNEKSYFSWVVPQPRAKVSGHIVIDGKEMNVDGLGYHDHNWGTVALLDTVPMWSWGRLYLEDYTCIFADILLSTRYGGAGVKPFLLAKGKQPLVSSFLHNNDPLDPACDFLSAPPSVDFPVGWNLRWKDSNHDLNIVLKTKYVLEKSDLLPVKSFRERIIEKLIAHPYYIRCYVTAKGDLVNRGNNCSLEGHGIYEQITFGR
jgi:hypothetical protein